MTIKEFAAFYVDVLEPSFRLIGFFLLVIGVLYFVLILKDGGRRQTFVSSLLNNTIKGAKASWSGAAALLRWIGDNVAKVAHVIIGTVKRYFAAKI